MNELKKNKMIRNSNSKYSSPVVIVKKKDGSERMCVEYRQLNKATIKDRYQIPRIDEKLDYLADAKIFSTIDLKSGYWQIPIREEDN